MGVEGGRACPMARIVFAVAKERSSAKHTPIRL